jgi:HSP20 family protein
MRWNPTRRGMDLFNEFDRMVSEMNDWTSRDWRLALDVSENEDAFMVEAAMPGINPDDLDITLEDNILTIQGETKAERDVEESRYHLRERRFGRFSRSLQLPTAINADEVEAEYTNGVLILTIPKAEEIKPKRIAIKANN